MEPSKVDLFLPVHKVLACARVRVCDMGDGDNGGGGGNHSHALRLKIREETRANNFLTVSVSSRTPEKKMRQQQTVSLCLNEWGKVQ